MNYQREWADRRHAAGFAAACARLALPFYSGDHRSDLVTAIEIAERYSQGEEIDADAARAAGDAAYAAAYAAYAAAYAADAAYAACVGGGARAAIDAADAATHAACAGIDHSELQVVYARWIVRDLNDDRVIDEELRQAAGAAIIAGDETLARELLQ